MEPVKIFKKSECMWRAIAVVHPFHCFLSPSSGQTEYLFAVVSDRGQDGAKGLEAHGDVQQVSSEEEVVEVSENRHGGVPDQIQEVLQEKRDHGFNTSTGPSIHPAIFNRLSRSGRGWLRVLI